MYVLPLADVVWPFFLSFFLSVSFILFAASLKQIDVSVAYAVWAALGTAMISVIGMLFFGEKFDAIKVLCVVSIVSGVVGLNLR